MTREMYHIYVESLFTNIPIEETINHTVEQKTWHKFAQNWFWEDYWYNLECTFKFNNRILKHVDGSTMGGLLWYF